MKKWDLISSEIVFDTKWYKVRKDVVKTESGKVFDDYFLGAQPDFINLIALFDNGDILVDRQYKHGVGDISLETIGGVIEKDEDPVACAQRELLEETGYRAAAVELLSVVYENPTRTISKTYILIATGLEKVADPKIDYNESDMELIRMPLAEFVDRIKSGEVFCEPAITAVFLACLKLNLISTGVPVKSKRFAYLPLLSRIFK